MYCAAARSAFAKLVEEVKAIESLLVARERNLALVAQPKESKPLFAERNP